MTVSPLEKGLDGKEKGRNMSKKVHGKEQKKKQMKNDSVCSFCDSSHWMADPAVGSNQRQQTKINTVVTQKQDFTASMLHDSCQYQERGRGGEGGEGRREGGVLGEGRGRTDGYTTDVMGQLSIKSTEKKK